MLKIKMQAVLVVVVVLLLLFYVHSKHMRSFGTGQFKNNVFPILL